MYTRTKKAPISIAYNANTMTCYFNALQDAPVLILLNDHQFASGLLQKIFYRINSVVSLPPSHLYHRFGLLYNVPHWTNFKLSIQEKRKDTLYRYNFLNEMKCRQTLTVVSMCKFEKNNQNESQ